MTKRSTANARTEKSILPAMSQRNQHLTTFFFPSCASVALARSSHIVVLSERITQMHTLYPSLGVRKWSTDYSQSEILPEHTKKQKPNKKQAKKENKNTTNPQSPAEKVLTRRLQKGMAANVPTNYMILLMKDSESPDHKARSCEVVSKTHPSAAPKPRIPPARIPEIALRSPPGIRQLRNEEQPCNELKKTTSVGTLPCGAPRQAYGVKPRTR